MLVAVATEYNNALLIIEREGDRDGATLQQVIDRGIQTLFMGRQTFAT